MMQEMLKRLSPAKRRGRRGKGATRAQTRAAKIAAADAAGPYVFQVFTNPDSMTGLESIEIGNEQDFNIVVQGRGLILKERETDRRVKQLFLYLDAVDALKNLKDTHYFYLSVAPDIRLNHLESFRSNMASGMEKQSSRVVKNEEELRAELGGSSISLFNSGEHIIFSKFEKDETGRQTSRAEGDEPEAYVEADSLAMNDTKFILH